MSLPTTNATIATAPPSLAAALDINGTVTFEIGLPIVNPADTRYQIIRSTNSGNAAVGTTVYDGTSRRITTVQPSSNHWFWARSYRASVPNSFSPYTPNTFGVFASPVGFSTQQIAPGATTFVVMANCITSQVFSSVSPIFVSQMGRVDFDPSSLTSDAVVQVTASYRAGRQQTNGGHHVALLFFTGVTSGYAAEVSAPILGSPSDMRHHTLLGQFNYTAGNSANVRLSWGWNAGVSSGPQSFTFDNVSLRTEFIKR